MQYFEDIELGQVRVGGSYELTEFEIVEFATKWDPFPFHIDKEAAEQTIFGGLVASGVHLSCILCRCKHDIELPAVVALLRITESRNPNPGRPGDVYSFESRVIGKKAPRTWPSDGIVVYQEYLRNQNEIVVLQHKITLRIKKRDR